LTVFERINRSLHLAVHGRWATEGVHEGSYAFTISRSAKIA
jgi:hypothetical protein